jgi:GAF domain-containing protein
MIQNKQQHYAQLAQKIESIVFGEKDLIANMANVSALIYWTLPDVNWAGFYLVKENQLVLGPFHGQPACIRIPLGKGVCGTAALNNSIQLIEDIHQFEGHISCDVLSKSEIVLPIIKNNIVIAVLDLDSPIVGRFDLDDKIGLTRIVEILQTTFDDQE